MRIFFAIWPDAPAADALARLGREVAARSQGRPVPLGKLHLTLAFLGEVPSERMDRAVEAGGAVRARPFGLAFDTVGWFRGARVAWTGCSRPPPELAKLRAALEAELRARDFALEERPFAPHVTLARKASRPVRRSEIAPISWLARELCLMRSEAGTGRYATLERWALE